MIAAHNTGSLRWVDVLSPSKEDIRTLISEYDFPADFAADLSAMVPYTLAEGRKGVAKITLDFPIVKRTDMNHPHEVKFIALKDTLFTIRFEDIQSIEKFQREFEVAGILSKKTNKSHGARLLASLLQALYIGQDEKLDYIDAQLTEVEAGIFEEREKEMVFEISKISRRLISFDQTLTTHERALEELESVVEKAFGKKHKAEIVALREQLARLLRRIDKLTQKLVETRRTNDSLLTTKQNEIMKILTIMAFITFPLTLFTSMFGMNTVSAPIIGTNGDFWVILGIMLIASTLFFGYFKYKRWM